MKPWVLSLYHVCMWCSVALVESPHSLTPSPLHRRSDVDLRSSVRSPRPESTHPKPRASPDAPVRAGLSHRTQVGRYDVLVSACDEPEVSCNLSLSVAAGSVSPAHCVATCSGTCEAGRAAKLVLTRADRFGNKVWPWKEGRGGRGAVDSKGVHPLNHCCPPCHPLLPSLPPRYAAAATLSARRPAAPARPWWTGRRRRRA